MTKQEAIKKVLDLARSQIGYCEKSSLRDLDDFTAYAGNGNYTKYARDMDNAGYFNYNKQGVEWCSVFVNWLFYKSFGITEAQKMLYCGAKSAAAGCDWAVKYYKKAKAYSKTPSQGDVIFFGKDGDEEHTGIVESVSSNYVNTIEGNKFNKVQRRSYIIGSSYIAGYGHPDWEVVTGKVDSGSGEKKQDQKNEEKKVEVCNVEVKVLRKGDKGATVKAMQGILIANGYSCGSYGADASFGPATLKSLKAFQKAKNLEQDGVCGPKTWAALLG